MEGVKEEVTVGAELVATGGMTVIVVEQLASTLSRAVNDKGPEET